MVYAKKALNNRLWQILSIYNVVPISYILIHFIGPFNVHCYKNYSPLQLVGTKHHGFATLVGPKSKHFGFQYKLMGEGYDVLKVHNRVITSAKSLNLLSTSWNCSKEFELASLEAWLVVQTIWYLGKSNSLILPIKKMTFRPKCLYLRPKIQYKTSWIPDSGWT